MAYKASTDLGGDAWKYKTPFAEQNASQVNDFVRALEERTKKSSAVHVKKTKFDVADSKDGIRVDSWRFQDWDYKKPGLPTYARGLFTTKRRDGTPEIVVRGYDKFFNVGEVSDTRWENIIRNTQGPYELTLKENGCIIFVSGLEDDTLLVCSKHSTGDRSDVEISHASAGAERLENQLARIGKKKADLAWELRKRNVTAVAELCDDTFEEHILAYGPDKSGLYLHGMNINIPEFMTYPSPLVQHFADEWGFVKTGLIVMDKVEEVQAFLEGVAETGAHDGRDVEGFVIRCKHSSDLARLPYQDWFFKYKFEEPYLMYRQWRECTKSIISRETPKYKKHQKITAEYLSYASKRLEADRNLAKLYNQNHGIIALRNDFLAFKQLKGSDAANFEALYGNGDSTEVTKDVILVPIATIGCGKTTLAVALTHLFGWGHVQNDNITGSKKRPPRFTKAVLDLLDEVPAVVADRNNAQRHEREQLITDVKTQHSRARLVALHYAHDDIDTVRRVTQARVHARGDNHQTIQAATEMIKVRGIMEGFIKRFEPCDKGRDPDSEFDAVINLDPAAGSRVNLEVAIKELYHLYPSLIPAIPSAEQLDQAIEVALDHKPNLHHTAPDCAPQTKRDQHPKQQPVDKEPKKKPLEYMSVYVPGTDIRNALERCFASAGSGAAQFYKQLKGTQRLQPQFHVTLIHRSAARDHPELWQRYVQYCETEGPKTADGLLGELDVMLERVVWDDRVMAIVVRLMPTRQDATGSAEPKWECVNKVAHITVGTRGSDVKPKESNDLLQRWMEHENDRSSTQSRIQELVFESKPIVRGVVIGVLSR